MSYYDVEPDTPEMKIGKKIYMTALSDRRGFRDDQLGIERLVLDDQYAQRLASAPVFHGRYSCCGNSLSTAQNWPTICTALKNWLTSTGLTT